MWMSVLSSSYIMANTVIVKRKHFVPMSLQLHYGFALVLVPLKNTAHLGIEGCTVIDEQVRTQIDASCRKINVNLLVLCARPGQPWWNRIRSLEQWFLACPVQHLPHKWDHWIIWGTVPLECLRAIVVCTIWRHTMSKTFIKWLNLFSPKTFKQWYNERNRKIECLQTKDGNTNAKVHIGHNGLSEIYTLKNPVCCCCWATLWWLKGILAQGLFVRTAAHGR